MGSWLHLFIFCICLLLYLFVFCVCCVYLLVCCCCICLFVAFVCLSRLFVYLFVCLLLYLFVCCVCFVHLLVCLLLLYKLHALCELMSRVALSIKSRQREDHLPNVSFNLKSSPLKMSPKIFCTNLPGLGFVYKSGNPFLASQSSNPDTPDTPRHTPVWDPNTPQTDQYPVFSLEMGGLAIVGFDSESIF